MITMGALRNVARIFLRFISKSWVLISRLLLLSLEVHPGHGLGTSVVSPEYWRITLSRYGPQTRTSVMV